jgi:hypothetical protein
MKKLILLPLLFLLCFALNAQNYEQRLDSLEFEIKKLEHKQTNIIHQLDLHQSRYFSGQILSFSGLGITLLSGVLYAITENDRIMMSGGLIGGTCMVSGFFLSMNSFKFLKKEFSYDNYLHMEKEMNETEYIERKKEKKKKD